jgi:hypothetical protein
MIYATAKNRQNSYYGDTVWRNYANSSKEADSIVVKTLKPALCSSCDVVPFNLKNESCGPDNLSTPIV